MRTHKHILSGLFAAMIVICLLAGALVIRQRALDQRPVLAIETGQAVSVAGSVAGTLEDTGFWRHYGTALTSFEAAAALPTKPLVDKLDAADKATQAIKAALAAGPSTAQRSQLMNLLALALEMEASADSGSAKTDRAAAGALLQQAVMLDQANTDAKFNLELLMRHSPQATKKDRSNRQQPETSSNGHPSSAKSKKKTTTPATLGRGY